MVFGDVLEALKNNRRITRWCWSNHFLQVMTITDTDVAICKYNNSNNKMVVVAFGWIASQDDLFADDWEILEG